MTTLISSAQLTTTIGRIGKHVQGSLNMIHNAAIQCIGYASVHGDIMHGVRLLEAVSKHHKQALVAFFEREGNFRWDKDAKALTFKRVFAAESFTDERVATLTKGKRFDAYSKPAEIKSEFDMEEKLDALLKSYTKAVADGKTILNESLFKAVKEAKAAWSGSQQDALAN